MRKGKGERYVLFTQYDYIDITESFALLGSLALYQLQVYGYFMK